MRCEVQVDLFQKEKSLKRTSYSKKDRLNIVFNRPTIEDCYKEAENLLTSLANHVETFRWIQLVLPQFASMDHSKFETIEVEQKPLKVLLCISAQNL